MDLGELVGEVLLEKHCGEVLLEKCCGEVLLYWGGVVGEVLLELLVLLGRCCWGSVGEVLRRSIVGEVLLEKCYGEVLSEKCLNWRSVV